MEKNLPVAYKSQHDPDAVKSFNDCGAASVSQIINFLGGSVSTDQVQEKTGADGGLVSVEQLQTAITSLGYTSEFYTNQTFESLKKMIDKDTPVIALVHYGSLNSVQDQQFKGGHFMPIVGYRADNGVYANDPNFQGELRDQGDHHNYTAEEFMKAWGDTYLDQNPPFSFLVISKLEQFQPKKVKVTTDKGLNLRVEANTQSAVVTTYPKGQELEVVDKQEGEAVAGNKVWYKTADGFIWSGGVEVIKMEKPKEVKEVKEDKDKIIKQLRKENQRLLETIKQLNKLTGAFIAVEEAPQEKKSEVINNVREVSQSALNNLMSFLHLS